MSVSNHGVYVVFHDGRWTVRRERDGTLLSVHASRTEAEEAARRTVRSVRHAAVSSDQHEPPKDQRVA